MFNLICVPFRSDNNYRSYKPKRERTGFFYEKAIRHHIPLHPSPPQIFVWCQIEAIRHHTEFSWRGMWCRIASIWHHTNFVGGGSGGKWGVVGGRWGAIPPRDLLPKSWRMSDREPVKQVKTLSCIILKWEIF